MAAVPDEFIDEGALVGPVARIRERYRAVGRLRHHRASPSRPQQDEAIELMAELAGTRPAA